MRQTRQQYSRIDQKLGLTGDSLPLVVAHSRNLNRGERIPFHHHRRDQLVYASEGVMAVTTRQASYVVPPHRAVWMPAEVEHRIDARSDVTMRTLYIDPDARRSLNDVVCVLNISPLLRELIVTVACRPTGTLPGSAQSRLMAVILDQIDLQSTISLALPMPADSRLLQVTRSLISNPANRSTLDTWARHVGASKRTLNRLFLAETGMTFSTWRQQLRLLRAVELLSTGESVTHIAQELGYENTSAFIAMFKRCLGTTPARYFSQPVQGQENALETHGT